MSSSNAQPAPPAVNFATEWLDEDGVVCPKNVDYATQCPKGHPLVPFAGTGAGDSPAQAQQPLMCRVCHGCAQREQAPQWRVCSVAGCCHEYAVCFGCSSALRDAPTAGAAGDDFPMLVCLRQQQQAPMQRCRTRFTARVAAGMQPFNPVLLYRASLWCSCSG